MTPSFAVTLLPWPGAEGPPGRQAQHKGMGWGALPSKRKFSLLGPPFVTQIRVVFLYLNAKTKKLYIWVCRYVCFFSKGEKPFWSPGAKFGARSLVRNKALLLRGVEGGSA